MSPNDMRPPRGQVRGGGEARTVVPTEAKNTSGTQSAAVDPVSLIADGLAVMWTGGAHEVRIKTTSGILAGVFDSPKLAAEAVLRYDDTTIAAWSTLNPVDLPVTNKLVKVGKGEAADNSDVSRRQRLVLDFDPIRFDDDGTPLAEQKVPTTDAEIEAARACRQLVADTLEAMMGWPSPGLMRSGNGVWLVYAIDLPVETDLVERVLKELSARFSTSSVTIDTGIHNAGRVGKIPGTMTRKGEESPRRPWRRASGLHAPDGLEVVPVALLEALAGEVPAPAPKEPVEPYNGPDTNPHEYLTQFLVRHGLELTGERADLDGGGYLLRLTRCPFIDDHDLSYVPSVGVGSHGGLIFKCMGDRCTNRGWDDFRALYESKLEKSEPLVVGSTGQPVVEKSDGEAFIEENFWEAYPWLGHVRSGAHSGLASAPATLADVLVRMAAMCPPSLKVPGFVGSAKALNLLVLLVGGSGDGKGVSNEQAGKLLPLTQWAYQIPHGTGEGIAEAFFKTEVREKGRKEKVRARNNVYGYMDEGASAGKLASRSSSILFETLRSSFSGKGLGQQNAREETTRIVAEGSYSFGLTMGIQDELVGYLFSPLEITAGTPQRFLSFPALDPTFTEEPPWPGLLGWTPPPGSAVDRYFKFPDVVEAEIKARRKTRLRGRAGKINPLDSQAIIMRMKLAALLALGDGGREVITGEDWHWAGILLDACCRTRDKMLQVLGTSQRRNEELKNESAVRREIQVKSGIARVDVLAQKIVRMVCAEADGVTTATKILRKFSGKDRDLFPNALTLAEKSGEIEVIEETAPKTGTRKRTCRCLRHVD